MKKIKIKTVECKKCKTKDVSYYMNRLYCYYCKASYGEES